MSSNIAELKELQTKLQALLIEKQQLMLQQNDIDRALKNLKSVDGKVYEMIGTILIEKDKAEVEKDLLERKQVIDMRLESIEKQERTLKSRLQALAEGGPKTGGM